MVHLRIGGTVHWAIHCSHRSIGRTLSGAIRVMRLAVHRSIVGAGIRSAGWSGGIVRALGGTRVFLTLGRSLTLGLRRSRARLVLLLFFGPVVSGLHLGRGEDQGQGNRPARL